MLPLLVVLFAVLAVAAGVWGMTQRSAAQSAQVRADALEERARALEGDLATAADKVTFAEVEVKKSTQLAQEQAARAEQAEKDSRRSDEMAEDAVKRAIAAETAATEAAERTLRAEADTREARADRDAVLAGAGPFQPEALWQLEVQRLDRLWKDRLALQPGEPSPMALEPHNVGAALKILADASREESGVVVDLMWHVDFECPPDRCVQLVRLGEELIASMRDSEGGELEVIGEEDHTVFFLIRTLPPVDLPAPLTAVLDDFGAMRELADTTVVVRVPPRNDAMVDAAAAGDEPAATIDLREDEPATPDETGETGETASAEVTAGAPAAEPTEVADSPAPQAG